MPYETFLQLPYVNNEQKKMCTDLLKSSQVCVFENITLLY
jgi:hypothetical protein